MYDSIYHSLVTNKRIDILSLHGGRYGIMWGKFNVKSLSFGGILSPHVVFMTLLEEHPMLKLSHFEVCIGHHIKIDKIKGLKVRK